MTTGRINQITTSLSPVSIVRRGNPPLSNYRVLAMQLVFRLAISLSQLTMIVTSLLTGHSKNEELLFTSNNRGSKAAQLTFILLFAADQAQSIQKEALRI
jgi:hypothetical protein